MTKLRTNLEFISGWIQARVNLNERGASLVEYALLVALIAIVCIAAITFLAGEAEDTFSQAGTEMSNAG